MKILVYTFNKDEKLGISKISAPIIYSFLGIYILFKYSYVFLLNTILSFKFIIHINYMLNRLREVYKLSYYCIMFIISIYKNTANMILTYEGVYFFYFWFICRRHFFILSNFMVNIYYIFIY
jgi:hypothetical protein